MGVQAKRAARLVAAMALGMAGLAGVAPDARAYGPVFECPAPRQATLQTLLDLQQTEEPDPLMRFGANRRGLECFHDETLGFQAVVGQPEGLGGVISYTIEPAWLDPWLGTRWLAATDVETVPGFSDGPLLQVRVEPDVLDRFEALAHRWVWVGARFDHPAAEGCRVAGDVDPSIETPSRKELVKACRAMLVVTDVRPLRSPCPPSAGADWAAITATPEHLRAYCFGGRQLDFEARAMTIQIAWDLHLPDFGGDWVLVNPTRNDDVRLQAFVAGPIPDPPDAPWHGREGIGGLDTLWDVHGHFNDPRAAACAPGPGVTWATTGDVLRWSPEDAVAFCRNSLIVDQIVYLHPTSVARPSPTTPPATAPSPTPLPSMAVPSPTVSASPSARLEPSPSPAATATPSARPSATPIPSPASAGSTTPLAAAALLVLAVAGGGLAFAARRRRRPTGSPRP